MTTLLLEITEIPHGHGLSLKKGIADGLLDCLEHENTYHETHKASYERGLVVGRELRLRVARLVKD